MCLLPLCFNTINCCWKQNKICFYRYKNWTQWYSNNCNVVQNNKRQKKRLIKKRKVMLSENGTLRGHVQWKLENFVSINRRLKTQENALIENVVVSKWTQRLWTKPFLSNYLQTINQYYSSIIKCILIYICT